MSFPRTVYRVAGLTLFALALAGCGTQDRAAMDRASQENVALKTQVNDLTQECDNLKKDLAAVTKDRDQFQKQARETGESSKAAQAQIAERTQMQLRAANDALNEAKANLANAQKSQGDAEQLAVKLKAAEDAVTAARSKAADAEKAASAAAADVTRARQRIDMLTAEKAALQKRLDAISADVAKKAGAPAPDLNK